MDPLSASAGIIGVTQQLYKLQKAFFSKNEGSRAVLQDAIGDLPVYIDILNEMSSETVSFRGNLPPSAHSCLQLCFQRASRVTDMMIKSGVHSGILSSNKTTLANLEYAMQQFRQAVTLMRDILMDARTHHLLREQQSGLTQVSETTAHTTPAKEHFPQPEDPTLFDASISRGIDEGPRWIAGRGILDSGCGENWVSLDIIKRAHLERRVIRSTASHIYTGFGGQNIEPKGAIKITWYANNAAKTRETEFLVAEQGPFDLLLGRQFIFTENIFIFNQAALVLRAAPISDAEKAQMEANAIKNSASNEELEAIRQAGEALARNQYREQNSSLLNPDLSFTTSNGSSTNSTVSKGSSITSSRSPNRGS